jgi:diguanylate cyclase (GGDEF)-like protein/PAS domain S-box-containing protein
MQPFALLFAASAAGSVVASLIMWPRRRMTPAAGAMTVTMIAVAWWSAVKMLSVLAPTLEAKLAFETAIYPGVGACVTGYFCYAKGMADRAWSLSRRTAVVLFIEPVLAATVAATNPLHHLFYASARLTGSPPLLAPRPGPAFWLHTTYSYALLGWAMLELVRAWVQAPGAYRKHYTWPVVAIVPPMIGNVITLVIMPQGKTVGLTPVFFCLSAAACCWALFRQALPDLVPVAGRQILETISDAVIVIDRSMRVLDLNPAADQLLRRLQPQTPDTIVGLSAQTVLGMDRALAGQTDAEYVMTAPDGQRFDLHVRHSPLRDKRDIVIGWVLVVHDVTERNRQRHELRVTNKELRQQLLAVERLRAELAELVTRDSLTGLHNRRYLIDALEREVDQATTGDQPLSVVMLDIDHFKRVNDRFGHVVGDEVIAATARRIAALMQEGETAARYGGEEFLLVLPGCTAEQARQRAETLRELCARSPSVVSREPVMSTISAGVAEFSSSDTPATLIDAADQALYVAKTLGRNRVEVARMSTAIT